MLRASVFLSCVYIATAFTTHTSLPLSKSYRSVDIGARFRTHLRGLPLKSSSRGVSSAPIAGLKMSIQASWDNHFAAFGAQDVNKILLDYTEESEIMTYDAVTGVEMIYKGLAGVRACFTSLFKQLSDTSGLGVSVLEVHENPGGLVYLVWKCPSSGLPLVVDSFSWDAKDKIRHQTICSWPSIKGPPGPAPQNTAPTGGKVQAGWDNHFSAFGAQDVPKILLDYTESSELHTYNAVTGEKNLYKGLNQIQKCFEGLFKTLSDTSKLAAPVIRVYEPVSNGPGLVFLAWECPSSGLNSVVDTFVFDKEGKILKQTVTIGK